MGWDGLLGHGESLNVSLHFPMFASRLPLKPAFTPLVRRRPLKLSLSSFAVFFNLCTIAVQARGTVGHGCQHIPDPLFMNGIRPSGTEQINQSQVLMLYSAGSIYGHPINQEATLDNERLFHGEQAVLLLGAGPDCLDCRASRSVCPD
jgi:hypothetical protein